MTEHKEWNAGDKEADLEWGPQSGAGATEAPRGHTREEVVGSG